MTSASAVGSRGCQGPCQWCPSGSHAISAVCVAAKTRSVLVATDAGTEHFDDVVLACHSDQSLALLADASAAEAQVLGAIGYQRNRAVLHTDISVLPTRRKAWAALT